jgi:hypothetical protein
VGRRGVISSFKLFLPAFPRVEEGGGGRHPVGTARLNFTGEKEVKDDVLRRI